MGRLAAHVAYNLQGKSSLKAKRHMVDHSHYCVIVNTDRLLVKGFNKMNKKKFIWHTGYPGGIHKMPMNELMMKDSLKVVSRRAFTRDDS